MTNRISIVETSYLKITSNCPKLILNMFLLISIALLGIFWTENSTATTNDSTLNSQLLALGQTLYENDVNRVNVVYELQGRITKNTTGADMAANPLFQRMPSEIPSILSYAALQAVQDNYILNTKSEEPAASSDNVEIDRFLDAVFNTTVVKEAYQFLLNTGSFSGSYDPEFKNHVRQVWFTTYKRQGANSSSGFEHVFVGEMQRGNKPSGLHNWVRYLNLEKAGDLNYLGWRNRRCLGETKAKKVQCNFAIVQAAFEMKRKSKKEGSSLFIGTSPEFELALYTVCLMVKPNQVCKVKVGGDTIRIRTRYFEQYVGTAFPIL